MAVAALPLESVVPADGRVLAGSQPVAVTVTGTYDRDHQLVVPGRVQGSSPADYVVTPLRTADGRAVLVVRGWQPAAAGADVGVPPPPQGTMTVTGWLVPSESLDAGTVDALTLPAGQVATVTAARVAGLSPYPILDGYVGLVQEVGSPSTGLDGLGGCTRPCAAGSAAGERVGPVVGAEPLLRVRVVVLRPRRGVDVGAGAAHRTAEGDRRRFTGRGSDRDVPAGAPPVPPAV